MNYLRPLLFLPNLRTERPDATSGYTWGKPAQESNILRHLPENVRHNKAMEQLLTDNCLVSERWMCSDDMAKGSEVQTEEGTCSFRSMLDADAPSLLGPRHVVERGKYLGCIMKQLDTNDIATRGGLSIQVHPASGHPERPSKPEMWKGKGRVYIGWKQNMTPESIRALVAKGTIEEALHQVDVDTDSLIQVDGGMVHGIRSGSFLAEWSKAPGEDDIAKGDLEKASVALWDRTDGKQPRPGKEDIGAAIEIMEYADALHAVAVDDILHLPDMLQLDMAGNLLRKLFATQEVHVDEYTLVTSVPLSLEHGGLPIYVEQGVLHIERDGETLATLKAGSECFLPYAMGHVILRAGAAAPAVLQTWYVPLTGVDRRI